MTLIELAIALVVLAILASLAMPSWQAQVHRTRRSDAIVALAQLQQAQERWRSQRPTYAASLGQDGLALSAVSPAGHYDLSTSVSPTPPQRATASPPWPAAAAATGRCAAGS